MKSEIAIMTFNRNQTNNITQRGRDLLTLIRDAGNDGIKRKGLTDALTKQLDEEDYTQLDLLEAEGFIIIERLDIVDHPDVEFIYRAGSRQD